MGYFITFKILYKKINFKDGFVYFENDSIIQSTFSGKRVIDCTKGIFISIDQIKHIPPSIDATYNLVIDYYDNNEKKQIVLASARTDSSKEEIERFINNFYYEEDKNIKKKRSTK